MFYLIVLKDFLITLNEQDNSISAIGFINFLVRYDNSISAIGFINFLVRYIGTCSSYLVMPTDSSNIAHHLFSIVYFTRLFFLVYFCRMNEVWVTPHILLNLTAPLVLRKQIVYRNLHANKRQSLYSNKLCIYESGELKIPLVQHLMI